MTATSFGLTEPFAPTSHGGACSPLTGTAPGLSPRTVSHQPSHYTRTQPVHGDAAPLGTSNGSRSSGTNRPPPCMPISVKEMLPIIMAAATWGAQWHSQLVACYCDNQAVVATLATRSSKEERLAHLLRCLFYFEALFQFELRGIHIPGAQNQAADALSRNRIDVFFQQVPEADPYPHPIPSRLVEILLSEDIDWLSPLWTEPFGSSTRKA